MPRSRYQTEAAIVPRSVLQVTADAHLRGTREFGSMQYDKLQHDANVCAAKREILIQPHPIRHRPAAKSARSIEGALPVTSSDIAKPDPAARVQPNGPWPVLRKRLCQRLRPMIGLPSGVN